jgi:hypothetical protein
MPEKRLAKNILTADKKNAKYPAYRHKMDPKFVKRIVQLDGETVPGAKFYSEAMWIVPGSEKDITQIDSHTHTWDELVGFFGYNYDDIQDLGAEIEFTIDSKKYNITKSFCAFIPAGVQHGPLIIRNVTRPVMHFTAGPTSKYE